MDDWNVIPESIRVDVEVFNRQHRPTYSLPNGKDHKVGVSLRSMVEQLGGWSGLMPAPWGDQYVSLEDLRDEDLDDTFVQISFRGLPVDAKKADPAMVERMARAPVDYLSLHAVADDDCHWGAESRSCWSLRELQKQLGGEEGNLPDRHGKLHHVSLRAWRHADPDHTPHRGQVDAPVPTRRGQCRLFSGGLKPTASTDLDGARLATGLSLYPRIARRGGNEARRRGRGFGTTQAHGNAPLSRTSQRA